MYVPIYYVEKKICWQSLLDFLESHSFSNIVVVGNLNIIFEPKEKCGGNQDKDPFLELVDSLIQSCDLLDIKPKKRRFTLMNNRVGIARLDHFISQSMLLDDFVLTSTIFPKVTSDHHPIGLCLEKEENLGPIPFRFSPIWIEREGFGELISHVWSQFIVDSPSYVWEQKLKLTKTALKSWIKAPLQNPTRFRVDIVQALAEIQLSMENNELSKFQLTVGQTT